MFPFSEGPLCSYTLLDKPCFLDHPDMEVYTDTFVQEENSVDIFYTVLYKSDVMFAASS